MLADPGPIHRTSVLLTSPTPDHTCPAIDLRPRSSGKSRTPSPPGINAREGVDAGGPFGADLETPGAVHDHGKPSLKRRQRLSDRYASGPTASYAYQ